MAVKAKALTKSAIISALAESTGLPKKNITTVFDALSGLVKDNLGQDGPGLITVPGLVRIRVVVKPAQPERQGIDPFTKQERTFKAKPERRVLKVAAVKDIRDAV